MFVVPTDLDLLRFQDQILVQICVGESHLQLHFTQDLEITIDGGWELTREDGSVMDRRVDNSRREAYRIHVLLGREVEATRVTAAGSISLSFSSGHVLTIHDARRDLESLSIQPHVAVV